MGVRVQLVPKLMYHRDLADLMGAQHAPRAESSPNFEAPFLVWEPRGRAPQLSKASTGVEEVWI